MDERTAKERCEIMAVLQFILDTNETSETRKVLPLEFSCVFGKEVFHIPLYEEEQVSFTALWKRILMELYEASANTTLKEMMTWLLQHNLTQATSFVWEEELEERFVVAFSDELWNPDLLVTITFCDKDNKEEVQEQGKKRYLVYESKEVREQQNTCYGCCGCAMERALEDPLPAAFFDQLCEEELFRDTLPYLILFQLQALQLSLQAIYDINSRMS